MGIPAGSGVVVTGAGRGIGEALALRMAAGGARVVVNDLDADAAERVAATIGGYAIPGDAASEVGVAHLIAAATDHLGRIDLYFANAGVESSTGLDSTEQTWDTSIEVNLMAHVRAARRLIPIWLDSGGGRLVVTASAAGLLTMPTSAPYWACYSSANYWLGSRILECWGLGCRNIVFRFFTALVGQ